MSEPLSIDTLVVGGGVAGLFALDALVRAGHAALLVEREALGLGQTTSSQGILHAGVKYALGGVAGDDAHEASTAAEMWRAMMCGESAPDLRQVRVLAREEFMWRTASLMGAAGMLGARMALRTRPEVVAASDRPAWLAGVRGDVLRLGETVIDPRDLLARLADVHGGRLALGTVESIEGNDVDIHTSAGMLSVRCRQVVLAAGEGNEALLAKAGLMEAEPMQRRPLRQAMVRGALPMVFGHCIDGAKTRVTITSDTCPQGVVWHVGGELAEQGARVDETTFLQRARAELATCVPGADLRHAEWSSYAVQRAEPRTAGGRRPPSTHVRRHGPCVAVWPVKLVMAPRAAAQVVQACEEGSGRQVIWPSHVPAPTLAPRPWETALWSRFE